MVSRKVYSCATDQEAWNKTRKKPLRLKWIDSNKGDEENEELRSRLVAQEINTDKSEKEEAEQVVDEHLVLYVITHEMDHSFSVAVVNTSGESLQYHATRGHDLTSDIEHNPTLHFQGIPAHRLTDGSFWFYFKYAVFCRVPASGLYKFGQVLHCNDSRSRPV